MTPAQVWMVIQALLSLVPAVVAAVRDGRIRASAQDEVINALFAQLDDRVSAARAARGLPDDFDPYAIQKHERHDGE